MSSASCDNLRVERAVRDILRFAKARPPKVGDLRLYLVELGTLNMVDEVLMAAVDKHNNNLVHFAAMAGSRNGRDFGLGTLTSYLELAKAYLPYLGKVGA